MGATRICVVFTLFHLVGLHQAEKEESYSRYCNPFECGDFGIMMFPFSNTTNTECGACEVNCGNRRVKLWNQTEWYEVRSISMADTIEIHVPQLEDRFHSQSCNIFQNFTLYNPPFVSFEILNNITLYKCTSNSSVVPEIFRDHHRYGDCSGLSVYYRYPPGDHVPITGSIPQNCSVIQLPLNWPLVGPDNSNVTKLFKLLSPRLILKWHTSPLCSDCHHRRGYCVKKENHEIQCANAEQAQVAGTRNLAVILGPAIAGGLVIICIVIFFFWRRKKWKYLPYFLSRNTSSIPSSAADIEGGSVYFGVPVFSYSELEEATNNFDPLKELGDGGFGTVYHGILKDGREVAVKRLYENNYKRVEQFMNEIEILTCLRHRNLVLLYGCTSRRSSELLLVYEYIPNGTVADHLHGDRSNTNSLPWPTRMNVAIETASALAYLHASDIIHRDVKTNNILLDSNFGVKVADFGLSRLFPLGVTHVSTAPQGTPGYVDPDYHQCYQLTDKSDVYSFGVVLIELISSMPAVDITRHRHEINLANLAVNRIQNNAFNELIDPSLSFHSDSEVQRMTTCVAELAFRCLQLEKEMRPSMAQVLELLKEIRGDELKSSSSSSPRPSPDRDAVVLLKNITKLPSSPNSVTDKWVSGASNMASSIG